MYKVKFELIIIYLLIGCVLTLASSSIPAYLAPDTRYFFPFTCDQDIVALIDDNRVWYIHTSNSFGSTAILGLIHQVEPAHRIEEITQTYEITKDPSDMLSAQISWIADQANIQMDNPNMYYARVYQESGWPIRVLCAQLELDVADKFTEHPFGSAIIWGHQPNRTFPRCVPLVPIFPEIILSILIYSVAFWMFIQLASHVRTRIKTVYALRAGICVKCGYKLFKSQTVCPECGADVECL